MVDYDPPKGSLKVLREGAAFLCVEKPAGLLSVPGKDPHLWDSMEHRVKAAYPGARLVHRLDMDTSGVMVFAKTARAHRALGRQFEHRLVRKRYLAEVFGTPCARRGVIDLPLASDWPNRPLQKVCYETGRVACTWWVKISKTQTSTCLALFPLTGRSHQLRVHLMMLGHPILGDRFYGAEHQDAAASRLMLHAERLRFRDPETEHWVEAVSEVKF